jgi:UDP-glucose 4-epimerase
MGKTALVTGGAGFIGSHLVEELVRRGYRVRVVDNLSTGRMQNLEGIQTHEFWLADLQGNTKRLLRGYPDSLTTAQEAVIGVDVVFHLACLPLVAESVKNPVAAHDNGSHLTLLMLDAARLAGIRKFVCASSSAVYGNDPRLPKEESMSFMPASPYAATKAAGEAYCDAFSRCYDMDVVSMRFFNVYGPRQRADSQYSGAIARFMDAIKQDRPPTIFGDGLQTRDFVYVSDVVEALILASESKAAAGKAINVGSGQAISIKDLAMEVSALNNGLPPVYATARLGDVTHTRASTNLAEQLIGFKAKTTIRDGLRKTWEWYSRHG